MHLVLFDDEIDEWVEGFWLVVQKVIEVISINAPNSRLRTECLVDNTAFVSSDSPNKREYFVGTAYDEQILFAVLADVKGLNKTFLYIKDVRW